MLNNVNIYLNFITGKKLLLKWNASLIISNVRTINHHVEASYNDYIHFYVRNLYLNTLDISSPKDQEQNFG